MLRWMLGTRICQSRRQVRSFLLVPLFITDACPLSEIAQERPRHPRVFISSWLDYAHKYGMGYALTDGTVGVHFNDASTMVFAPSRQSVYSCGHCRQNLTESQVYRPYQAAIVVRFSITGSPEELQHEPGSRRRAFPGTSLPREPL